MRRYFTPSRVVGTLVLCLAASALQAQGMGHGMGHSGMHGPGPGHMHDEATMPGLRGLDASAEDSAEMAVMFRNFQTLRREVEHLPNGIRTVTRSTDPDVMAALQTHADEVSDMAARGMQAVHEKMMQGG